MKTTTPPNQEDKCLWPYRLATLLTVVLLIINHSTYAQSTCATAIDIGSSSGDTTTFSGSDVWFKFEASSSSHRITIGHLDKFTPEVELTAYSGSCGSLSTIEGPDTITGHVDVIDVVYSGLTASTYYYLKVSPSDTGTTYIESRSAPPTVCNCITTPQPCERVCNGNFEDYLSGYLPTDVERACPWERVYTSGGILGGTPDHWDISGFGSNLDGAIGMICGQNISGFVFQEYAQVELEQSIANGESAIVSYYVKRSPTSVHNSTSLKYTVDHFAGVLSNGPLVQPVAGSFPPPVGTVEVDYNGTLPANWTQVTEIVSNGTGSALDHIGFGVFEDDASLGYVEIDPSGFPMAYTLVDEVSVTQLEECSGAQWCVGDDFDIGFSGLPSGLTFQWYHPLGNLISGATSSTYSFTSVAFSDAGVYNLQISDGTNTYDVEYELIVVDCCDKAADIEVPLDNNTSSYLINSLNGGNATVTSQTVRINGVFTVDQDITFSGSDVLMGIDAKIILDPGKSISFVNFSELKPCDDAMYEGVIADREDETIIFRSSTARGGKTALASYNNAKLTVVGSDFEDNYIGIGVYDFQPATFPYTGSQITIYGNEFTHSGSNLITPYSSQPYPYICIDVENSNELEVGGSNKNYFYDFQYGIYAITSEIKVFNAEFDQNATIVLSNPDPDHAAIYCIGPTGTLDYFEQARCTVTNTHANVKFIDCQVGIFCREFYLSCNDAEGIGNGYDIRMRDFDGADIWDNDFDGTNGTSVISVSCQNVTPRLLDVGIYANEISSYRYGIQVFNVLGNGGSYETKVYNNDVDFTATNPTNFRQGITILGCSYSEVYNNSVEKTFGVSGTEATKLVGIRVEQTTNADIYENTIDEMGRAMLGRDNLSGTQYWCNTMDGYYEGWFFDNATLSNQLISGGVQDNRWYNPAAPPNTDITGTATTSPTLFRSTAGGGLDPDQQFPDILTEFVITSQSPCEGSSQIASNGGINGGSSMTSLAPSVHLPQQDVEYNSIVAAQITIDSASLSALSSTPSATSPEGRMGALYYNLQNGDWSNLTSSATSLAADSGKYFSETNTIIDAYVNYYAQGIDFPTSVRNDLLNIAYSGGIAEYGPNVLSAWVMLGMDGNSELEQKAGVFSNEDFEKVKVYPNPTSGRIVIESDDLFQAEDQEVTIEIMDIFGRTIFRTDVVFTGKAYGFYLNDMPAGIYQLSLQYNNTSEVHSIVIK